MYDRVRQSHDCWLWMLLVAASVLQPGVVVADTWAGLADAAFGVAAGDVK